jgi:hypothetical protein
VIDLITTRVVDGTLEIASDRSYSNPVSACLVKLSVTVPSLEGVELLGAGGFSVAGVSAERLEVLIGGAGSVDASGSVGSVEVLLKGSGKVEFFDLAARNAHVVTMVVGDVEVKATDSLFARIFGVGDVIYSGNPAEVDAEVSGVGSVRPR